MMSDDFEKALDAACLREANKLKPISNADAYKKGARWAREWWFNNGNDEWHKTALEEINIKLHLEEESVSVASIR